MRRSSKLSEGMRRDRVEAARRLTGEQRLEACVRLSRLAEEFRRAGDDYRTASPKHPGAGA